jgi:hypothetical protein
LPFHFIRNDRRGKMLQVLKTKVRHPERYPAQGDGGFSIRPLLFSLVGLGLLLIVALKLTSSKREQIGQASTPEQPALMPERFEAEPVARTEAQPIKPREPILRPAPVQPVTNAPATTVAATRLTEYETKAGKFDENQAARLAQDIRGLITQGAPALATIGEYLDRLKDVGLDGFESSLKYPTLRTALMDAAHQIGGPESTQLFLKTLQTSADPFEVGLLAKFLNDQAPGQFGANIADAARDTLQMAAKGELQGRDVGAAFKALEIAQQPNAAEEMQSYLKSWRHYALMGLAALPNEAGVPALVQQIQTPENAKTTESQFALQLLAQISTKSPQAQAALVQAVSAGIVPDSAWPRLITGLAGDQYLYGDPRLSGTEVQAPQRGLTTYHIRGGNENFYSLPIPADSSDIGERQRIIESLLNSNPSPGAKQALEKARMALTAPK